MLAASCTTSMACRQPLSQPGFVTEQEQPSKLCQFRTASKQLHR